MLLRLITLEDEPKPLYFTPYKAPILVTDYEALLYWYPELEQPNPGSRANDLVWYIREYLKRCKLPEDEMLPPGSVYQESVSLVCLSDSVSDTSLQLWLIWSAF